MKKRWDVIELLRHSRHDWLNVVQLIKGNIALNRLDRVEDVINTVIQQARNETKLSNLGIPLLTEEFLTFNWENHLYKIEFEVLGEAADLSKNDNELLLWCQTFFNLLDETLEQGVDNHLLVTFQLIDTHQLIFDFQGQLSNPARIEEWLKEMNTNKESFTISDCTLNDQEILIVLTLS
ncbi:sporulation initiation phosphotransferase B [Bacillus sp. FJAT-45350]|uniref:sporulation initiation phosphotransferase B n=1 Tax=Bacillus sp. FJAT-45350 TaxID=2011014 RepID=UPI000BB85374|nr:sporulation initiation phosphotransferase B [Bacillus sp. FJAT-45350]